MKVAFQLNGAVRPQKPLGAEKNVNIFICRARRGQNDVEKGMLIMDVCASVKRWA